MHACMQIFVGRAACMYLQVAKVEYQDVHSPVLNLGQFVYVVIITELICTFQRQHSARKQGSYGYEMNVM